MTGQAGATLPRLWEVWDVEWVHRDEMIGSSAHPAICVAEAAGEEPPYFIKISGSSTTGQSVMFRPSDSDFLATGLTKQCYAHIETVRAIQPVDLLGRRGVLGDDYRARVVPPLSRYLRSVPPGGLDWP